MDRRRVGKVTLTKLAHLFFEVGLNERDLSCIRRIIRDHSLHST